MEAIQGDELNVFRNILVHRINAAVWCSSNNPGEERGSDDLPKGATRQGICYGL